MNRYVVRISDAQGIDAQATIGVEDRLDLGRAAQLALDQLVEQHGSNLAFPIFVDIHPAAEFTGVAALHREHVVESCSTSAAKA